MKRRRARSRVYWRERGGICRAYGEFRDYADLGGGQEALVVPGEKLATADPHAAEVLAAKRLEQLGLPCRDVISGPTGFRQVFVKDPDGNMVEFIGPTKSGAPRRMES